MPDRLKNLSFRWYYASIYLGLAMIFGSQYFTYENVRNLSLNSKSLITTVAVLNQTAQFALVTKDFQSTMRGYLITHDEDILADNYQKKVALVEITDTLFNLVRNDSAQSRRVREMLAISSDIIAYSQHVIDVDRLQGREPAFAVVKQGHGIRLGKSLAKKIREIVVYEKNHLDERKNLVAGTQRKSFLFILTTSLVGFFLTVLSIVLFILDKRKQQFLQKEINEKERVLNQYLEAIPDGVMVINKDKEIVLLNQSGREILGIKTGRLNNIGDELNQVKLMDPTRYLVRFNALDLPVIRGLEGEKLIGNKIDLIKDNKIYHLETNVQPIIGLEGKITSAITVFRDITERANYEATLEKARTLAEKSVHVKDIFLSNVSHEIRTPLNAIIGFTNLLEGEVSDPKSIEYVNYIQVASKNLLELINDILDFSKIEAGQVYLEKTATSIPELIQSISVIISQRATEKGIQYQSILADGLPQFVESDKLRLTQILLNVCGNAVKFTEKGSVKLFVEPVGSVVSGIQKVRFEVRDTGIGIPEEKIKQVFNRFVQATESTTRMFGGTGLGLSIVKSLVELFEGDLDLRSELGKGSVFTMEFPMKVLHGVVSHDEDPITPEISSSISSLKVLAAEDNLLNQKLLKAIFERLHIPLTIVNNGKEALDILGEQEFDIVLMDIQMPVMDGYDAIKAIRRSISKTIPIITMTAHAMVGEKEECLSIGANSYISKPFKESELLNTIAVLGKKENTSSPTPHKTQHPNPKTMSGSLLNLEYLSEITGGDIELRDELISLFSNDSRTQLSSISALSAAGDIENLRQSVHKFRSSLFSVGMLSTANQYKEVEATLKQGIWNESLKAKLIALKAESESGLKELQNL